MRLLLDELFPPAIAVQLRRHGHDAATVQELGLTGASDEVVWERASGEDRILVTENARDLVPLAQASVTRGRHHPGLIVTSNRSLPRHRGGGIGSLVLALLRLAEEAPDLHDRTEWLAP